MTLNQAVEILKITAILSLAVIVTVIAVAIVAAVIYSSISTIRKQAKKQERSS